MISAFCNMMFCQSRSSDLELQMMRNSQQMASMAFGANMSNVDTFTRMEKDLTLQNQQNYVQYMINNQLAESYKKLFNKKVKESAAPKFGFETIA